SVVPPPFERVQIPYEGHMLPALFWPGRGKAGNQLPVVYNYCGADGILLLSGKTRRGCLCSSP
ncbi:MAG: hypothetical protein HYW03_21370, partial [Deltaproteobacteria bacterium]|nr:hypothetical protein [Deltaproteobacteria bacterium]